MTDKKITLETVYGGFDPTINAPWAVTIKKNSKLKWENKLDNIGGRSQDGEIAKVKLYAITDNGKVDVSAEDFCEGYDDGALLILPAKDNYQCTVVFEGVFKYDVIAEGHETLDPIVIVQPPPTSFMFVGAPVLLAALVFAGLGYYVGFKRGSNQKSA